MRFIQKFKKTIWGFRDVDAKNLKDAKEMFENGLYAETDNNSDYEFEEITKED